MRTLLKDDLMRILLNNFRWERRCGGGLWKANSRGECGEQRLQTSIAIRRRLRGSAISRTGGKEAKDRHDILAATRRRIVLPSVCLATTQCERPALSNLSHLWSRIPI